MNVLMFIMKRQIVSLQDYEYKNFIEYSHLYSKGYNHNHLN